MKIFLSWSGEKSKFIAQTLSNWLEQVLQVAEPWISTDIVKGKRWSDEIATELKESKVAIICLTNDNLDSKWIHFEAGAIAKTDDAFICTFLYDVKPANVQQPLSQFQNTKYSKSDVLKLIKTINSIIGSSGGKSLKESNLVSVFNTFWPQLEEKLKNFPESNEGSVIRTDRELLEESLQILRSIKNNTPQKSISERRSSLSNNLINSYIDSQIKSYANNNSISLDSTALDGYENRLADYIISINDEIPSWVSGTKELISMVKNRIDYLPPF